MDSKRWIIEESYRCDDYAEFAIIDGKTKANVIDGGLSKEDAEFVVTLLEERKEATKDETPDKLTIEERAALCRKQLEVQTAHFEYKSDGETIIARHVREAIEQERKKIAEWLGTTTFTSMRVIKFLIEKGTYGD